MTRSFRWSVVTLACLTAVSFSLATAEPPASPETEGENALQPHSAERAASMIGLRDPIILLNRPAVRTDLELSPAQTTKVEAFVTEVFNERRKRLEDAKTRKPTRDPDELAKMQEEVQAMLANEAEIINRGLGRILTAAQCERLDQIALQVRGMAAISDPLIAVKLQVTKEQSTEIQRLRRIARRQMTRLSEDLQDKLLSREEYGAKNEAARVQACKDVFAVLTDAQREQFAKMQGKPFDLDSLAVKNTAKNKTKRE